MKNRLGLCILAMFMFTDPSICSAQYCWWQMAPRDGYSARARHAMAFDIARGVTVSFGGRDDKSTGYRGDTWEYDGDSWVLAADESVTHPGRRSNHAMVYDSKRGVTVLFGGWVYGVGNVGDTWEWDGRTWEQVAITGPSPRAHHAMAYDSDRGVTVMHGGDRRSHETWEWDGSKWEFRADTPEILTHTGHSMAYDSRRKVTVHNAENYTWEWDGSEWTQVSTDGPYLVGAAMSFDENLGVTVLFGGRLSSNFYYDATWHWDGSEWERVAAAGLGMVSPSKRGEHAMVYDSKRELTVLFGGQHYPSYGRRNDTWEWDGTEWKSKPGYIMTPVMCFDSTRSKTVLFGHAWGTGKSETWEWDGAEWDLKATESPPWRSFTSMAFDSARGVSVVFGGRGPDSLGDTWEWDGIEWRLAATTGPSARSSHQIAYDSSRGVTVLFGGFGEKQVLGDTWEWDGIAWELVSETGPPSRQAHGMAYDETNGCVVLFGGKDSSYDELGDTWIWDGVTWTFVSDEGPSPRYGHAMDYDSYRNRVYMHGGRDENELSQTTFQWNGDSWKVVGAGFTGGWTRAWGARESHALSFDSARRVHVLYGGYDNDSIENDIWELACPCIADCDQSTGVGTLDVFDFLCFQHNFIRSWQPTCDCDMSTGPGVCDISDFLCFQNAFVAGCP